MENKESKIVKGALKVSLNQAKRATTAAPTIPATPMLTALAGAAADLLVVAGFEPVVVVAGRVVGAVVPGAVVVVIGAGVVGRGVLMVELEVVPEGVPVTVPEVVVPVVVPVPEGVPEDEPEEFKQDVSGPGWTLKGADWPEAPVLSLMVRPREVPGGKLTLHVMELPGCVGKLKRAGAVGWLPGRMLKKYGGVPPLQVNKEGWQTTGFEGVLMVSC